MKKKIFVLLISLPHLLFAQINIFLPVTQNPGLGFSITKTDTTIVKGGSVVLAVGLTVYGGSGANSYLWAPAASLSNPTVLNPRASPADTTNYLLTVTDKNGCSFTLKYGVNVRQPMVKYDPVYSPEPLLVLFFPNPGRGEFKIQLQGIPEKRIDLLIFNSEGKLIHHGIIKNFDGDHTEAINLNLESGVYTLRIISGDKTLSRLFVIN